VANRIKTYCRDCKQPWIEHARHVDTDGRVKDCIPMDNLAFLEWQLEKRERQIKEQL